MLRGPVEFIEGIRYTEKLIIVEGRKDKAALESLGARNVVAINCKPLHELVEEAAAASRKVIILTDLDREGRLLYGKLRTQLQFLGVEVDNYFRKFMFRNTRIRQVEGLAHAIQFLQYPQNALLR